MSFWDVLWLLVLGYLFVAYLMLLFSVIGDLTRDRDTGGLVKGLWILALILLPFATLLVYLVVRGRGMAERQQASLQQARAAQEDYVRGLVASSSPVEQVEKARSLLDSGAIDAQEYTRLKEKALAV